MSSIDEDGSEGIDDPGEENEGDSGGASDNSGSSGESNSPERNLTYDRGDRSIGLDGDKYVKELDSMFNDFKDWAKDNGFTVKEATGGQSKQNKSLNSDFNLSPDDKSNAGDKWGLTNYHDWLGIAFFAISRGFNPTSTIGGAHNKGSLHSQGGAVDLSVRDKTNKQIDDFIKEATDAGFKVRDERERPAGQAVWDGAHLHISDPQHRGELTGGMSASGNINKDSNATKESHNTHDLNSSNIGWGSHILTIQPY